MLMERTPEDKHETQWDELAAGPQPESYGDEQDITDVRAVREIAKAYFEKRHAMAPEQAKREAHTLNDIQQGFISQRKRDKERGRETSKEEFLKWEQDYAHSWNQMREYIRESGMNMDQESEIEAPIFFSDDRSKLVETIEAQAGKYFSERSKELLEAILASDGKTKETDRRLLGSFFRTVMDHVSFRYMTPLDIREQYGNDAEGYKNFEWGRTAAHNAIIKHLNELNRLAKKYGTTPFTPRDFWTSEAKNQTPTIARRMKCDRNTVEAYYRIAFSDDLAKEDERRQRAFFH